VNGEGMLRRRLFDMGITPGASIIMKKVAPLGDPIEINVRGYELSLRKSEASQIIVEK
jgi:Fe2+ transport system protein FeoA